MYAEIHAVDQLKDNSPGKRSRLDTDDFKLWSGGDSPDSKKFLELTAEKSGIGSYRTVRRQFTLQLTEEDLQRIFSYALEHGLFGIEMKNKIRAALAQLTDLAADMKVRLTKRTKRRRRLTRR